MTDGIIVINRLSRTSYGMAQIPQTKNERKTNMITEDYVSFEVAKLLKEKGFNEKCRTFYNDKTLKINHIDSSISNEKPFNLCVLAPTIQMTLKWLREIHNIFIEIYFTNEIYFAGLTKGFFKYRYRIYNMGNGRSIDIPMCSYAYEMYEEAVEAAIKYCLVNLI